MVMKYVTTKFYFPIKGQIFYNGGLLNNEGNINKILLKYKDIIIQRFAEFYDNSDTDVFCLAPDYIYGYKWIRSNSGANWNIVEINNNLYGEVIMKTYAPIKPKIIQSIKELIEEEVKNGKLSKFSDIRIDVGNDTLINIYLYDESLDYFVLTDDEFHPNIPFIRTEKRISENSLKNIRIPDNIPISKAKEKTSGKWVIGLFSIETISNEKGTYLAPVIRSLPNRTYADKIYEVDINTVCPYTHMKDIAGNLIFANDILRRKHYQERVVVLFEDGQYNFAKLHDKEEKIIGDTNHLTFCSLNVNSENYIVDGNILD